MLGFGDYILMKNIYANKMSGTLSAGNLVGTNNGILLIISSLGGDVYGTNKGIINIT